MTRKIIFYLIIAVLIIINVILDININNYIEIVNDCFYQNVSLNSFQYSFICFIIAFISILFIWTMKLVMFCTESEIKGVNIKTEDGTFGTANWLSNGEIDNILCRNNIPGLILGKRGSDIIKLPFDSHFNKNICVFGSSGSMKTIGFLVTNLLELLKYKKSIIVTDAKRRNLS